MVQNADQKLSNLFQAAQSLYKAGKFRDAAKICLSMLKENRDNPGLTNFLGIILHALKKPNFANLMLARANRLAPDNASYLNNQASVLLDQNRLEQAEPIYLRALSLEPNFKNAAINLAKLYNKQGQHDKSLKVINDILLHYPDDAQLIYTKGKLLTTNVKYSLAYDALTHALELNPDLPFIYFYLGVATYNLKNYATCINYFQSHTAKHPEHYTGWIYLGNALNKLKKRKISLELQCYRKAIALEPDNPVGYYNIANSLINMHRYSLAEKILKKVIAKDSTLLDAYISYGYLEFMRCNLEKAEELHHLVLSKNPNSIVGHTNLSLIYLLQGKFEKGWKEYEYRWQHEDLSQLTYNFSGKLWSGESLDGKTLLVYTEQGFGDVIQFIRYLSMINKGTGKIIVECRDALIPLLETVKNIDSIVPRKPPFPEHEYYIPLLSLPGFFNTTLTTIPCDVPYISVDESRREKWHNYFIPYRRDFKIGISWSGSAGHRDDKTRSTKPKYFASLKMNENIKLFALQKGVDPTVCVRYDFINLDEQLADFADTAACIEQLDLVISVDTSLVHLAGALNFPTWALLAYRPDWRWMLGRDDSPWYPSVRLFRQSKLQDWHTVFEVVKNELTKMWRKKIDNK